MSSLYNSGLGTYIEIQIYFQHFVGVSQQTCM